MTKGNKDTNPETSERSELQRILCIHYFAQFDEFLIKVLIDSGSEANIMQLSFAKKLGLCIVCKTDVGAQSIDSGRLETFAMVIVLFLVDDKDRSSRLFEKTFLLGEISMDVIFEIPFLTLRKVKINFSNCEVR